TLAVRQPGIPVAVHRIVDDERLDLAGLEHLLLFAIAFVVGSVRPGLHDAVERVAVAGPLQAAGGHRQVRQLARLGFRPGHDVNLTWSFLVLLLADEGEALAVGRPGRARTAQPLRSIEAL